MSPRILFTAGVLACSTPTAGVNVAVTYDATNWNDTFLFDHITVVATGGGLAATACVLPDQAPSRVIGAEGDAGDPCANAFQGFTSKPTWTIQGSDARTINFDFPSGVAVTVQATAALGNAVAGQSAVATLTASTDFPSATLTIEHGQSPTIGSCGIAYTIAPGPPTPSLLPIALDPCGYTAVSSQSTCPEVDIMDSVYSPDAIACTSVTSVHTNTPDGCISDVYVDSADAPIFPDAIAVSRVYPVATQTAEIYLTGHFAQCSDAGADGGCFYTTACTPPTTRLAFGAYDLVLGRIVATNVLELDCLPATPSSLTLLVAHDDSAPISPLGFLGLVAVEQPPVDAGACDFVIDDLSATPTSSDAGL
jgi:hypothetical protein